MLRSLKSLEHYTVAASDGDVGRVVNFLLDDEKWTVRYLVVDTGHFFSSHRVLLSPIFFRSADWKTETFHLAMTREKIKGSPGIDADRSVSRQHEFDYYGYYGYPYYWGYTGLWGMGQSPGLLAPLASPASVAVPPRSPTALGDTHLRSVKEVVGYEVAGTDGGLGHVADFIVDDDTWEVKYLAVETGHWWAGKSVLVSPRWARSVSWDERNVAVDLSRQAVKDSPEWNPQAPVNREYEARLYDYYGRPVYW